MGRSAGTTLVGKGSSCPCGGESYATCCGPLHEGARDAKNAEELMRSRYSAFARNIPDYLWETLHSTHEDRQLDAVVFAERFSANSPNRTYRGLRIIETRPPDADGVARVLFTARIRDRGRSADFSELSYFALEDGRWRYITGVIAGGKSELKIDALEDRPSP